MWRPFALGGPVPLSIPPPRSHEPRIICRLGAKGIPLYARSWCLAVGDQRVEGRELAPPRQHGPHRLQVDVDEKAAARGGPLGDPDRTFGGIDWKLCIGYFPFGMYSFWLRRLYQGAWLEARSLIREPVVRRGGGS